MMSHEFENYYLQTKGALSWETIEEAQKLDSLVVKLEDQKADFSGLKVRIIGAAFDEENSIWKYQQLFFYDLSIAHNEAELKNQYLNTTDNENLEKMRVASAIETSELVHGSGIYKISNSNFLYVILIVGGLITAISFGVRHGFGIFLSPISLEFGFGREVFALAIALQNLVMGFAQPFVGAFADKFGAFRTIVLGTLFYSAGLFVMAFSTTPDMFYISTGVLAGVGLAGSGQSLIMPAVAKRFPAEKRSWVLGVVGATGSLGGFIALPIGQYFLTNIGWSETSLITGFLILAIIPLALVFRSSASSENEKTDRKVSMKEALIEAVNHNSFWFLCAGFFVCGFHVVYVGVHLPSYVTDLGLSAETGAWALSIIGLMNIVGGYSAGVLGGKFPKKYLLSGLYLGRSLVMIGFLLLPPSDIVVFIFAIFMGLFWLSTVPLTTGLVADLYGTRYMTMLYGIVFLSHQLGAFCGGWLGGYVYDTTGSYNLVWWVSVVLGLISMIAHWPIRPVIHKELSAAV